MDSRKLQVQRQFGGLEFLVSFVTALKLESSLSFFGTKSQNFGAR